MNDNKKLLKQLVIAGGVSLFSLASVNAAVNLQVDDNIKVTVINGEEVTTGIFEEPKKSFTLQPGKHVITAKYDRLYILPRDEHDYLRSSNITVTADMQDNQTYRLAMPGQPERYKDAKEYIKKPTLAVMQGSNIIAQETSTKQEKSLFSGLSGLFGGNDAQLENQKAIAAISAQPSAAPTSTTVSNTVTAAPIAPVAASAPAVSQSNANVSQPSTNRPSNANTLDNFMQLWLQASPKEREKIRQWVDQ